VTAAVVQALVVIAVVAAVHIPLGNYMARVYTASTHWRAERLIVGLTVRAELPVSPVAYLPAFALSPLADGLR
jgi:K+-transporting ATPase A subunit